MLPTQGEEVIVIELSTRVVGPLHKERTRVERQRHEESQRNRSDHLQRMFVALVAALQLIGVFSSHIFLHRLQQRLFRRRLSFQSSVGPFVGPLAKRGGQQSTAFRSQGAQHMESHTLVTRIVHYRNWGGRLHPLVAHPQKGPIRSQK